MRQFNQQAYDEVDLKAKQKLVEIAKQFGKYNLVGRIEQEHYKKYDILFITDDGKTLAFENEVRQNFNVIESKYDTIHIPIRKKNTLADFYIVWNDNLTRFFLIRNKIIKKYANNPTNVQTRYGYAEDFIDIPKNEAILYEEKYDNKFRKV